MMALKLAKAVWVAVGVGLAIALICLGCAGLVGANT